MRLPTIRHLYKSTKGSFVESFASLIASMFGSNEDEPNVLDLDCDFESTDSKQNVVKAKSEKPDCSKPSDKDRYEI